MSTLDVAKSSPSLAPDLAPLEQGSPRIALEPPNPEPGAGIEPATIRLQGGRSTD
jgi:hypothetical protein